ncbi:MAG: CCA tRNA nucleotidyltransferase [Lentisphaerae bacterium]|jgi:poly(A) polymerase|nr:CCA tRNA nucleotidyltransferase [Lentisphaerota bacterium]
MTAENGRVETSRRTIEVPPAPLAIVRKLHEQGHEAHLVGGCVRDALLGRTPKDWDIATSARPEEIEALFPKTVAVGKAFGIMTVVPEDAPPVEVATFRSDAGYADGRRPESVQFTNAVEDARRRDFTINSLLYDPASGAIHDTAGGQADLAARLIRAIGDPARRFAEDHLRMLRAVRFAATLGFTIEPATLAAIQAQAGSIRRISAERVRDELFEILTAAPRAGEGLQLLLESGLLAEILPEVAAMVGVEQPPEFHPEGDVFTHTKMMLDAMEPGRPLRLALAVLLHDVGKPVTAMLATLPDGTRRWRFEGHAPLGAEMTREILTRLRAPTALVDKVSHMVGNHMRFGDALKMRPAKVRRLIGAPTFEDELELHRLDCLSSHALFGVHDFLRQAHAQYVAEPVLPEPLVMGRDLVVLGLEPGPRFKHILQALYDLQLEGENDKAALLAQAPQVAAALAD